jgi:FkbM family methyltransferase
MSVYCKLRTLGARCHSPAEFLLAGLRAVYFTARAQSRLETTVRLRDAGMQLFLPPRAAGVTRQIYALRGNYEIELRWLRKLVGTGGVAFDIGANVGIYTAYLSAAVGGLGKVVAFEPFQPAYSRLRLAAGTASAANVAVYPFAIGRSPGHGEMRESPGDIGSNSVTMRPGAGTIEIRTIDQMVAELGLPRLDFIKLDIEGGELDALRGGLRVIRSHRPTILVEMNPQAAAAQGSKTRDVFELLRGLGYSLALMTRQGGLNACLEPPTQLTNMLALPNGSAATGSLRIH